MIQDILILVMPVPVLFHLQLSLQKRIKVIFIFSAGLVTTVFAILRFPGFMKWHASGDDVFCEFSLHSLLLAKEEHLTILHREFCRDTDVRGF
jgi:hypothetical protein